MKTQTRLKNLHVAPRKARLVANLIRGLDVEEAKNQLHYLNKKSAPHFEKLLKSAIANAENNFSQVESNLFVAEVFVDEGPVFKRWQPRAFGRAFPILKKTCHVSLLLDEKEEGKKLTKKTDKKETEADKAPKKAKTLKKAGSQGQDNQRGLGKKITGVKDKFFRRKSG
ncbi:50S ribosomal protein L22 [Patescibacteria group bacterium]|nr:50S ribosomal protein L22 [Patescibacteria group bacterium]